MINFGGFLVTPSECPNFGNILFKGCEIMVTFDIFLIFCLLSIIFYISLCIFVIKVFLFYNKILIHSEVKNNDRYN